MMGSYLGIPPTCSNYIVKCHHAPYSVFQSYLWTKDWNKFKMSWSSLKSLSKKEDKQERKVKARVDKESVNLQDVKDKLRASKRYKDLDEPQLSEIAQELTTKEDIKDQFSHLYSHTDDTVCDLQAEERAFPSGEMDTDNEREFSAAHKRSTNYFDRHAQLRVRLLLSPLRVRLAKTKVGILAAKLTQLHGPLHAALLVGDIKISWDNSSLVVPERVDPETGHAADFEASVGYDGEWGDLLRSRAPQMAASIGSRMDYHKQIDLVVDMATDKARLIDQLAGVIVNYNAYYYYSLFGRNCQGFVKEALKALEIRERPVFKGEIGKYYSQLRSGKTISNKFESHAQLDDFVVENLDKYETKKEDMEYLLCLYFDFHRRAGQLERNDWECELGAACKMGVVIERSEELGSQIMDRYLAQTTAPAAGGATP